MIWLSAMVPAMIVLTLACWLADTPWADRAAKRLERFLERRHG